MANPVPLPLRRLASTISRSTSRLSAFNHCGIESLPQQVPVPQWHHEILDERLKDHEANREAGESWDVFRDRLRDN